MKKCSTHNTKSKGYTVAMKPCKECGSEISKKANACPNCGAKQKRIGCLGCLGVAFIVFMIIGTIGSSLEKSRRDIDNKTTHEQGDTVSIGYTSYCVWKSWYSETISRNRYANEPADADYLFVEVTVRNDDTKPRTIPPFKLIDQNGSEYHTTSKAYLTDQVIGPLHDLNPSVQKRGLIVFDVPSRNKYNLIVSGGFWSSEEAIIALNPEIEK